LSKKLCKRCWEHYSVKFLCAPWDDPDEYRWDYQRVVWCPWISGAETMTVLQRVVWYPWISRAETMTALTTEMPPQWCPYAVEHIAEYAARQEEDP